MNKGILLVGAGAAVLYFMSRPASAAINPATGLPYSWNPPPGVNPAVWASQPSGVPGYTNGQLQAAVAAGGQAGSPLARTIAAMGPGGLSAVIGGTSSLLSRLFGGGASDTAVGGGTVSAGADVLRSEDPWGSASSAGTSPAGADILRASAPVEDPWGTGGYTMPAGILPPADLMVDPWGTGGYTMPAGLDVVSDFPDDAVADWGLAGLARIPWTTGFDHRGDFDTAALGRRVRHPSRYRGPI